MEIQTEEIGSQIPAEENEPRYSLPVFEGPLDLLLYLVDKNELDIYDIPIALVTEQYNRYISRMKDLNLYIAADFISMAATLIHIKSQMLLPRHTQEELAPDSDPRKVLVEQLLEHKKLVELSFMLGEKEALTINQFHRRENGGAEGALDSYDLEVWDLISALKNVLQRMDNKSERVILVEEQSTAERMEEILEFLKERKTSLFTELLPRKSGKPETVLTFLAILEMAKKRIISIFQEIPFGPIRILKRSSRNKEAG